MNEIIARNFSSDQMDLLKRTICKEATDDEFQMFVGVCKRTGLDPFAKQIHAVKRWDSKESKYVMSMQVAIDGFRLIAQRSNEYEGQTPPQWCSEDGIWKDVWLSKEPPSAARIGVWRKGFKEPCWGVANFNSYKQLYKNANKEWVLTALWAKMPEVMIAKCAESLALRKAFPQELSDLHTEEEMQQADVHIPMGREEAIEKKLVYSDPNTVAKPEPSKEESKTIELPEWEVPSDYEQPNDWKDALVHVGRKYIGKKLGELKDSELQEIYDGFKPKAKNGSWNPHDLWLKSALLLWKQEKDSVNQTLTN
jgi:phage recombination protein Bet